MKHQMMIEHIVGVVILTMALLSIVFAWYSNEVHDEQMVCLADTVQQLYDRGHAPSTPNNPVPRPMDCLKGNH